MQINLKVLGLMMGLALLGACADKDTAASTGSGAVATTGGVTAGSQEDLVANVGDRVFFVLNSNTLSADARTTLDRQAAWMARFPAVSVQLAGNCDERGTTEFNLALGQRRSNSARDYLVARGVSSARIVTTSNGKERPTALGSDEQAYAQNRNSTTSVR